MPPLIRTLTLGLADPHPISASVIQHASMLLDTAHTRFVDAGYEVQTLRLSTRPLFDDLPDWSATRRLVYAQSLQRMLDDVDLGFCSLGTIHATRPTQPLEHIEQIVDILATTTALNMTVQLASSEHGLREDAALPIAHVMRRLAQETDEGFGNFRFAMLACVEAGCPFFPTAYHTGPTSLSLGLQGASIVTAALIEQAGKLTQVTERVKDALIEQVTPIVALGQAFAAEQNMTFGGVDLSPAPLADDSITAAIERSSGSPAWFSWNTRNCSGSYSGIEEYGTSNMWLQRRDVACLRGHCAWTALGRGIIACTSATALLCRLWNWFRYNSFSR